MEEDSMHARKFLALAALTMAAYAEASDMPVQAGATPPRIAYPESRRGDQAGAYHGVQIQDPSRWLEDLDSQETAAWVAAQRKVTNAYLDTIPERDEIRQRLTKLWNYERYSAPFK